jgi:hypothetical protein
VTPSTPDISDDESESEELPTSTLTPITRTILGEEKPEEASLTPVGGSVLKPVGTPEEEATTLTPVGGSVLKPVVDLPEESSTLTPVQSAVLKPVGGEPPTGDKPSRGQPPSSGRGKQPESGRGPPPSSGKGKPPGSDDDNIAKLTPVTMLKPLKLPGDEDEEDEKLND